MPHSGTATEADSVLYDDVVAVSVQRGVVLQDGFEEGIGEWGTAGQPVDGVTASTATTFSGQQAARNFHRNGLNNHMVRSLGTFQTGDVVSASVWFKARPGVYGAMFLGNDSGPNAYDNSNWTEVRGNGEWQQITLRQWMTHADTMVVAVYAETSWMPHSGTATEADSVLYDDVVGGSIQRSLVLQEGFENGIEAWGTAGQPVEVATASTGSAALRATGSTATSKGVAAVAGGKADLAKGGDGGIETMSGHSTPWISLTAEPATIRPGGSAVLTCDVINATYSELSEYGALGYSDDELIEYVTVRPSTTTTYILTAYNDAGSSTAQVTVTVDDGTPPPGTPSTGHNLIYGFGQLISESRPDGVIYIQGDQVGSPNLITDASGVLINRTKNLPFGERLVDGLPGVPKSLRRFTNHEEDPDSNAIYMQARTYLAGYGKFAQVDPAYDQTKEDPETWNLYNYVTNNPVTKTDPDGRMTSQGAMLASTGSYMDNDGHVHFEEDMVSGAAQQAKAATQPPQQRTTVTAEGNQGNAGGTRGGATPVEAQGPAAQTKDQTQATSKSGTSTTANQSGSAPEVPAAVKVAIGNAVAATNAPNTDDKKGGFHEEGGIWGKDASGNLVVSPAQPGQVWKRGDKSVAIDEGIPANPKLTESLMTFDGKYHVHPPGAGNDRFDQPPSPGDLHSTTLAPINIVVGAQNGRVYFYNATGITYEMSLKDFLK